MDSIGRLGKRLVLHITTKYSHVYSSLHVLTTQVLHHAQVLEQWPKWKTFLFNSHEIDLRICRDDSWLLGCQQLQSLWSKHTHYHISWRESWWYNMQKRNLTLMTIFAWTILQLKSMCSASLTMKPSMMIHLCKNSACYCVLNLLFYSVGIWN